MSEAFGNRYERWRNLHVRPDEVPDVHSISTDAWYAAGGCNFCGIAGHPPTGCPNRPIRDFFFGSKKSLDIQTEKAHN